MIVTMLKLIKILSFHAGYVDIGPSDFVPHTFLLIEVFVKAGIYLRIYCMYIAVCVYIFLKCTIFVQTANQIIVHVGISTLS